MRVAKGKHLGTCKVAASNKPMLEPLYKTIGYNQKQYVPTVSIALDLDIPDEEFEATRILLEHKLEKSVPAVELKVPTELED